MAGDHESVDSRASGFSPRSRNAVRELKEEFRRSLLLADRANSGRNLRPSEIQAEMIKRKQKTSEDSEFVAMSDREYDPEDFAREEGGAPVMDSPSHGSGNLIGFLGDASSDEEEEDAEDAAYLLKMPIEESKEIKYVFKKQRGRPWYRLKVCVCLKMDPRDSAIHHTRRYLRDFWMIIHVGRLDVGADCNRHGLVSGRRGGPSHQRGTDGRF